MLKYELTQDDLIAFSVYAATRTPQAVKESSRLRLWIAIGTVVALALVFAANGSLYLGLAVGLVVAALLWLVWNPMWRWATKANARRFVGLGQLGAVGEYRIWADESGVHQVSPKGRTDSPWQEVLRVEDDDDYIFLFTGELEAYLIPRTVESHELERFLQVVYRES